MDRHPGVARRPVTEKDRAHGLAKWYYQCQDCEEYKPRKAFPHRDAYRCTPCHEQHKARVAEEKAAAEAEQKRRAEAEAKARAVARERGENVAGEVRRHPGDKRRKADPHEKRQSSTKWLYRCETCRIFKPRADYASQTHPNCMACTEAARQMGAMVKHGGAVAAQIDKMKAEEIAKQSRKIVAAQEDSRQRNAQKQAMRRVARAEARKEAQAESKRQLAEIQKKKKMSRVEKELASRLLAQRQLLEFVLRFKPDYQAGWVHLDICRRLEKFSNDVVEGKSPRLLIQTPPRIGKSLLVSDMFPSWHLGRNPTHEFIVASYAESLPLDFSRNVRDRIHSPEFKALFPHTLLSESKQNATGWRTTKQGGYIPVGIGGPLTGRGAHCLVIDDFCRNSTESESENIREMWKKWYLTTAYSRLAPGGGVCVTATRWHFDDLAGWLENQMLKGEGDEWEIVRYPMEALEDEKYRKKGDPLHPARFPKEAVERIKRNNGGETGRFWNALYQQRPVPDSGGYFTEDCILEYQPGELPNNLITASAWDLAIGRKQENDRTAGLIGGVDTNGVLWLLNGYAGRWPSDEIVELMLDAGKRYATHVNGVEHGQISMALGPLLDQAIHRRKQWRFYVQPLKPGRQDKPARARTIQGLLRQGMIRFPAGQAWVADLRQEMLRFPHGAHDDFVDALAWLGLLYTQLPVPRVAKPEREKSWKDQLGKFTTRGGAGSFMSA